MNRLLGKKKEVPRPTLTEAIQGVEGRSEGINKKIAMFNNDLSKVRDQMAKMRDGPSKELLKQKALRILKQKRMYEEQQDKLHQQMFSMDQTNYIITEMEDHQKTVAAMKDGLKTMRTEYKKLNITKIEKLQDSMADMMEKNNEINEALTYSHESAHDLIDESELEAELDLLGPEFDFQSAELGYMDEAQTAPTVPDALFTNEVSKPTKEANKKVVEYDDLGLPKVPMHDFN